MAIRLDQAGGYEDLKAHIGHELECVGYGPEDDPENVAIECIDCGVVVIDFNRDSDDDGGIWVPGLSDKYTASASE